MSQRSAGFEGRIEEYWEWFAVALFLLVTVDLLSTIGATVTHGVSAEANPLVAWLVRQGPAAMAAVNLLAVVVAVYAFSGVVGAVRRAPPPYDRYLEGGVQVWLGLLLAVGLFVFANNLAVIVLGRSLV